MVLVAHSPELVDGNNSRELLTLAVGNLTFGVLAVDGFFLLSGYLIVQSWVNSPDVFDFLRKRVLRIYPGFIVASLICALIVGPLGSDAAEYFQRLDIGDLVTSIVLLQTPAIPPVFQGQPFPDVNGSMWTISLEFFCYLSVLALGAIGAIKKRQVWLTVTALIFAVIVIQRCRHQPIGELLRLASFFFAGGSFYLYKASIKLTGMAAAISFAIMFALMFSWRAAELAVATFGAYVLFYAAFKEVGLSAQFRKLPDVSYGVYLYGWPVQKLILWHYPTTSPFALFSLSAVASVLLGTISWYAVEKPGLRFKLPRSSARVATDI